jgi:hypothetical protein
MPAETPKCDTLTWKAKDQPGLNVVDCDSELWRFVETWIKRFKRREPAPRTRNRTRSPSSALDDDFENFIYLWVSVNAWASMAVPDQSRNHEDAYLVQSMSKDAALNAHFANLLENQRFREDVANFAALGPVFQVLWMRNHHIRAWRRSDGESRSDFVARLFEDDPFHRVPGKTQMQVFPAFAPACAKTHFDAGESIPADWPHLLHMIYQVRCNLFHGGKTYESAADRDFVNYAFTILWRVWRQIIPSSEAGLLSWDRVFIRSGVRFMKINDRLRINESDGNLTFIGKVLNEIGWGARLIGNEFSIPCEHADEQEWLDAWEHCRGGAEGGPLGFENIELGIMDTHLSGVVRWLNGLGIKTTHSCEGHEPGKPCRLGTVVAHEQQLAQLIASCSGNRLTYRDGKIIFVNRSGSRPDRPPPKHELLILAECLHGQMINSQMLLDGEPN